MLQAPLNSSNASRGSRAWVVTPSGGHSSAGTCESLPQAAVMVDLPTPPRIHEDHEWSGGKLTSFTHAGAVAAIPDSAPLLPSPPPLLAARSAKRRRAHPTSPRGCVRMTRGCEELAVGQGKKTVHDTAMHYQGTAKACSRVVSEQ